MPHMSGTYSNTYTPSPNVATNIASTVTGGFDTLFGADDGYKSLSNISLGDAIGNMFTGNIDYQRQLEVSNADRAYNTAERKATELFNSLEAQKNRDYQERMSNTAYQRAAADLKAAGFNPANVIGTSGAATTAGSVASSHGGSSSHGYSSPHYQGIDFVKSLINLGMNVATLVLTKRPL